MHVEDAHGGGDGGDTMQDLFARRLADSGDDGSHGNGGGPAGMAVRDVVDVAQSLRFQAQARDETAAVTVPAAWLRDAVRLHTRGDPPVAGA